MTGADATDPGFDALTEDALHARGSLKWTKFGPAIGAFVAEMDFGTAPVITRALHDAIDAGQLGYLPAGLGPPAGMAGQGGWRCRT